MKKTGMLVCAMLITIVSMAQEVKSWTEDDRKYLLDNLIRNRDEVVQATKGLSKKQWTFKESADRWSINEVLEHIARFELIFDSRVAASLQAGKNPERMKTTKPDSTFVNFIMEDKPHYSLEYTKPFSYSIPMGLNDLESNLAWFLKMRNEFIEYVRTTKDDLRMYFNGMGSTSIHQTGIYTFGHADRHLRQIARVKRDLKYPK